MQVVRVREDSEGNKPWERIEETFEVNGGIETLTQRAIFFDDGVVISDIFVSGVRVERMILDNPEDPTGPGERPYTSITIFYDETGALQRIERLNDDGTDRVEAYVDGRLFERIDTDVMSGPDGSGAQPWTSIRTTFDEFGNRSLVERINDDGTDKVEVYVDGILRERRESDNPGDPTGGAKPWTTIRTEFDEFGNRSQVERSNDDGTDRLETYIDGILRERIQTDNPLDPEGGAKVWSRIRTEFDEFGNRLMVERINDDGTDRVETYIDGVLRQRVETDNPFDPEGGAQPWATILTEFDETGTIIQRLTSFDDGRERTETFIDGVLRERIDIDGLNIGQPPSFDGAPIEFPEPTNNYPWQEIRTLFDASGNIESRATLFDDTDTSVLLFIPASFNEEARRELQLIDGDGDETWLARRISMDEEGTVTEITDYSAEEGIPDDFLEFFVVPDPNPSF